MNAVKSEPLQHAAGAGARIAAPAVLLALLLAFKLSLATDGFAANLTLGSGFGLLEVEDSESEYRSPAPPDFVLAADFQLRQNRRYAGEFATTPSRQEVHTSLTDIRAPPGLS